MLRWILRAVAPLLVFIGIGVVVTAMTEGAFVIGGGVASCQVPAEGGGPVPTMVQGGYRVSFVLQAGDIVVRPSATLLVEPETVRVTATRCRATPDLPG